MFGPASFYDPDAVDLAALDEHAQRYQQWIDSYEHQPQPAPPQQYQQQQPAYQNNIPSNQFTFQTPRAAVPQQQQRPAPSQQHENYPFYNRPSHQAASQATYANRYPSEEQSAHTMRLASASSQSPVQASDDIRQPGPSTLPSVPKATAKRQRPVSAVKETKRKRTRKALPASESDTEDDDDFGMGVGISVGMGGFGLGSNGRQGRLPGACTHCKKLKMKCDFPPNDNTCRRCKQGGHACIVEGRKPRTAPNKREYLLAQIRQKDSIIESLLKQLHNPYVATPMSLASYRMATSPSDVHNKNVTAWLDRLQSSVRDSGGKVEGSAARNDGQNVVLPLDNSESDESERNSMTHAQRFGLIEHGAVDDTAEKNSSDEMNSCLPESEFPLGLIASLSLDKHPSKAKSARKDMGLDDDGQDHDVGVANEMYFMPGPSTDLGIRANLIEQHSPPEILVHGLVTPDDVEKLFEIFYTRVNPFFSLLDPALHTPSSTFARCPFLFTVICAVSSRYYSEKSEMYPIAMHFAKHSAANALIDGWKTVELCQAYILLSAYSVPARHWEEDRSWLYTGLAIRIATDLNLHQMPTNKPQSEKQERELLNRMRVWMICFNIDRSTATQFGKPTTIKEDYLIRTSADWYTKSKYNLANDVHMCAHTALLRIIAAFHEKVFSDSSSATGLNRRLDFKALTIHYDEVLTRFSEEWTERFRKDAERRKPDPEATFRASLSPFLVHYSRLVMHSFGFQHAFQQGMRAEHNLFFNGSLEAAKGVVKSMIDDLAPTGFMRYAPDGHFVFAAFASAFLLKLLRPEFKDLLKKESEAEIFDLIGRLIQTLSCSAIAIDDRHTPRLYAKFLAGLLSRHRGDGATVGKMQALPPFSSTLSSQNSAGPSHNNAPSTSTFSVTPAAQSSSNGATFGQAAPLYRPAATYPAPANGDSMQVPAADMDLLNSIGGSYGGDSEEMLAVMQTLNNPSWWQTMMMPGFSWPEQRSSPVSSMSSPGYTQSLNGANYGLFPAQQATPLQMY